MNIATWVMALIMNDARATPPPLVIYPLGDSITHGMDQDGYRRGVAEQLHARGRAFRFVGTLEDGSRGFAERAHDGHDGWVIEQITANVEAWLGRFKPDVVLLMIGANDVETGADLSTLESRFQRLLARIVATAPTAEVLVAEISVIRDPRFDAVARAFNARLSAMVSERRARGQRLTFVPMHDALGVGDLRDLDHPTTSGNAKMAARWMEYLGPIAFAGGS